MLKNRFVKLLTVFLALFAMAGFAYAASPVTLQVDMSIQKQMGTFDPATNILVARGSFETAANAALENWKGNLFRLTESATPDIYTLDINMPDDSAGVTFEFKYVIDDTANANDSLTQGGSWESVDNRTFTLQAGGQVLDVVYFNNQAVAGTTADVTFKADVSDLVAKGWFDPAGDTLRVVGSFNDWSQDNAQVMKRELLNPNMLSSTESVTAEVGSTVNFKFRAAPNAKFLDNGWEMGDNHSFTFDGNAMTLDPIKPNIGYAGEPLPQDVTVQFSVDVRNATETYHNNLFNNIKGVWIKGDKPELGSWGGAWTNDDTATVMVKMYDDGATGGDVAAGDMIYSAQVTFPQGTMSAILYKYGIVADSTDTLNAGTSYLDNEAGFAVNHSAVLPGDSPNFVLPVDRFGSLRALPNAHVFRVDMSIQKQMGNFDPVANVLVMRGSFESVSIPNAADWKGNEFMLMPGLSGGLGKMMMSPSAADPDVYELAVPFYAAATVGQTLEYKYVIEDTSRYTDHATQSGSWESVDNRTFTVMDGGDTLDVVFFNNQSVAGTTADVTFKADVSDLVAKGWFDPAGDTLRVVGSFNDWSQDNAQVMKRELLNPNMLSSTESVTAEVASTVNFKFRAAPNAKFLDNGWEMGDNHSFTFDGNPMTLAPIKPNIGYAGEPLPQDVTVTFSVYTVGATETYHNLPFNNIKSVWMKGDKPELGAWGGAWTYDDTSGVMVRMYDDGIGGGDQTAGDGFWTAQVVFPTGTMSAILYKYGIAADGVDTLNGGTSYLDNEAGFANNHSLVIPGDAAAYVAPADTFGSQRIATAVADYQRRQIPTDYALHQNHPNPFNPSTAISYDLPKESLVKLAVYNVLGQKVRTLIEAKQQAGYHTVRWNGQDDYGRQMATGMYIYRIEAGRFIAVRKMLLMK